MFGRLKSFFNSSDATSAGDVMDAIYGDNTANHVIPIPSHSDLLSNSTFVSALIDKAKVSGSLPLNLYSERSNGYRERYEASERIKRIFTHRPCDYMSLQGFIEMAVVCYEVYGKFYAQIDRRSDGEIHSIEPLHDQLSVTKNRHSNGGVTYTYYHNGEDHPRTVSPENLFILEKPWSNNFKLLRPVNSASMISINKEQDDRYYAAIKDGLTKNVVFQTDARVEVEGRNALRAEWREIMSAGGIPVLEEGLKLVPLNMSPDESKMVEIRELDRPEILAVLGSHRGRLDPSLLSNLDESDDWFLRNTITPLLNKIESEFNKFLPDGVRCDFNYTAFYRGTPTKLNELAREMLVVGVISVAEVRDMLGFPFIEGSDKFVTASNNINFGSMGDRPVETANASNEV